MGCALHSRGSRPLSTSYGAPWLSVLSLLQLGSAVGQTTYCNVTLAMKIGDSGAGINFTLDSGCPTPPLSVSVRCTVFPTPTLPSRHGLRPVHCFTGGWARRCLLVPLPLAGRPVQTAAPVTHLGS